MHSSNKIARFLHNSVISVFQILGIGLVEKKSKTTVHWRGGRDQQVSLEQSDLHADIEDLKEKVRLSLLTVENTCIIK